MLAAELRVKPVARRLAGGQHDGADHRVGMHPPPPPPSKIDRALHRCLIVHGYRPTVSPTAAKNRARWIKFAERSDEVLILAQLIAGLRDQLGVSEADAGVDEAHGAGARQLELDHLLGDGRDGIAELHLRMSGVVIPADAGGRLARPNRLVAMARRLVALRSVANDRLAPAPRSP